MTLIRERSDWVETYYDKAFSLPLTGDPATDGFATEPSAILVEAVKDLSPGTALDAAMGQGRNAVFLARRGWKVSGFDLSAEAIKQATANASRAGVRSTPSRPATPTSISARRSGTSSSWRSPGRR